MKQNNRLEKQALGAITLIVFIAAIIVIMGWIFDIAVLKSILPGFVTMKFSTAVAFLISSIILLGVSQLFGSFAFNKRITLFFSIILLLFMGYILVTTLLGISSAIENLVIKEAAGAILTVKPGLPSTATMIDFVLISLAGLFSFYTKKTKILKIFAVIISISGLSSIFGYIFNKPFLYFYFENISSAMALHTAFLFLIIGVAIWMLAGKMYEEKSIPLRERIFLGFFLILFLIVFMVGLSSQMNNLRLSNTEQLRDVEAPLGLMVQQVIGYDAILTGAAHAALLHAQKGEVADVSFHKDYYDEIGAELDNLLKIDAPALLEKSKRAQEIKDRIKEDLAELDRVNLLLVDLETRAFAAIEKNDTKTAFSLIVAENYDNYKYELAQLYSDWADLESQTSANLREQIIQQSKELSAVYIFSLILILLISIIVSFNISSSISRQLKRLEEEVEEVSKGKLDLQLEKSEITEIQGLNNSINRILATLKLAVLRTGLTKAELGLGEAIKAKEEAEEKYRALYETSSDAIMTLEPPTWKFTSGNPAAIGMFIAKDEKDFTSRAPWEFSPEKQSDGQLSSIKAKKMIETAIKEGKNFFEWTHRRLTGEDFPATVLLSRVKEGDKTYL
ncbi:MAG: hypothetical protein AABX17_01170 [Nanoarchaeota archaeon]